MPDPLHFDSQAETYAAARPPYPPALWDRLREIGFLRRGLHVLELGAGAGAATSRLVEEGATVTAVEPGTRLARLLRERVPTADVLVARAEDVDLAVDRFDRVVVATAVHWLDLDVVVPKVHQALVPEGQLAVWRTVFGDPEVSTPFRREVAKIVGRRTTPQRPSGLDTEPLVDALTRTGHFVLRHVESFRWSLDLATDQVRGLFTTFSDWSAAEVEEAARAVDRLGGVVTEHYVTPLVVLERADRAGASWVS